MACTGQYKGNIRGIFYLFQHLVLCLILSQPTYALQVVMCIELTPILACVVPTFNSLLVAWTQMLSDPSKVHLSAMLDTGMEKLSLQYNKHRFSKSTIIAMGSVGDPSKIRPYSSLTGLLLSLFSLTAFSSRKPKNKRKAE